MSTFYKSTIKIAVRPGVEDTAFEYTGLVLRSCPLLAVTPDSAGRDCYTLTHVPTGQSVRTCLKMEEARALALKLAPLVADGWNTDQPSAVIDYARNTPEVWAALRSAPGKF